MPAAGVAPLQSVHAGGVQRESESFPIGEQGPHGGDGVQLSVLGGEQTPQAGLGNQRLELFQFRARQQAQVVALTRQLGLGLLFCSRGREL